jgi:hypothetical protein
MPTIIASAIINKAKTILQDTTSVRWTDAELLGWLNDGQREVSMRRPDVSTKLISHPLVAGTKQAIPADGIAVLKVIRNMGTNGLTPGRAVRHVAMDILDSNVPTWHTDTASSTVVHAVTDMRIPRTFYVYPPAISGTQVELLYAAPPAELASTGSILTVDDAYAGPLVDWVCSRAYDKDQDTTGSAERSASHRAKFDASVGAKTSVDQVLNAPTSNVKG